MMKRGRPLKIGITAFYSEKELEEAPARFSEYDLSWDLRKALLMNETHTTRIFFYGKKAPRKSNGLFLTSESNWRDGCSAKGRMICATNFVLPTLCAVLSGVLSLFFPLLLLSGTNFPALISALPPHCHLSFLSLIITSLQIVSLLA